MYIIVSMIALPLLLIWQFIVLLLTTPFIIALRRTRDPALK